ncbi:hypothetical protein [Aequorivita sinensis]|uniref:hypothetical protein n=1 Tax=Aequorivita sinensis TaxID=1382458 RepID=UPI0023009CDF|nr:hypothetical protein [Aequorivita sinensis]
MIDRRNILELIGKHRSKYHSCILTCYSFDFSFFEERVLPTLRLADIKNVNVLADGHFLEMAQEATTGKEFKHNKTYNFLPIYETGVFHPKIMLLTGKRHGLLILGSGNMTSSGLSTNDEIWGAFHLDNVGNENAPLFGAVWQYLQPFLNQSLGFVPQKLEWIRKHSPWLEELPVTNAWVNLESLGMELKFLANTNQASIYSQLIENIPNKDIEQITVVSPYYDRSGHQLLQLKNHFQPAKLKCIVDPQSGLLPINVATEGIDFYNWADCKQDYDSTVNRLHAKLIHFKDKEKEYLVLGSANMTLAALGTPNNKAANAEAGILITRPLKNKTWIEELAIKIPENTIQISEQKYQGIAQDAIPRINYQYRVLYAELRGKEITIYLNKNFTGDSQIIILDREDIPVENIILEAAEKDIVVQITDPDNVFKLALINDKQERISNFAIIHRLEALLRCNPDSTQEKLNACLEQDFPDGEGITELLQFVDYNWADEESTGNRKVFETSSGMMRKAKEDEQKKEYKVLEASEFNRLSAESILRQSGELSNSTVKIAEFLNSFTAGAFSKEEDFNESSEQILLEDNAEDGSGDEVDKKKSKRTNGVKEKAAIIKYFKKLDSVYSKKLSNFLETKALTETPKNPITIRSLSSILIGLQLIQIHYGRKFEVISKDIDAAGNNIIKEENYLNIGTVDDSVDSVKGFLSNVLGKFLLLSGAGSKPYEYDIINQKLINSQNQLLQKSIAIILNTPWREKEKIHRNVLLLNCLYFSVGEMLLEKDVETEFIKKLNEFAINLKHKIPDFDDHLDEFKNKSLPNYLQWLSNFSDEKQGRKKLIHSIEFIKNGTIIFNSKLGFSVVHEVIPSQSGFRLTLERAGFPFENGNPILKQVQFGTKIILFR